MKKTKEKKKRATLKQTFSNNFFAIKTIFKASPMLIMIYIGSSLLYGTIDFLCESFLLREIVNGISEGKKISDIIAFVITLGSINIFFNILMQIYWNFIFPVEQRKIGAYVEKQLFNKAKDVELACYENPSFYDKYVKAMDEAYNRILRVMYTLDNLVYKIVALSANSLLLFYIDPLLILFGLFPLVLGIFRRLENIVRHEHESKSKPINRRENYVQRTFYLNEYAKEMRIGGMYTNMLNSLEETFQEHKKLLKEYGTKRAVYGFIQKFGLECIAILGATLYSVWSAMCIGSDNGGMKIGDCLVVLGSIGTISYCLNDLIANLAEFGEHALFLDDVRYFLDYTPKILDGSETADIKGGDVKIKNLSFKYDGSDIDTLKNIDLTWRKGERIALVGKNGSGKSTLVKLLLRLYDPTEGSIEVDGKDIKRFTLRSYRDLFGTVFQDFKLFSLSVKDNVLLRPSEEKETETVINALKESGAYPKISKFEKGIDTILTKEFDKEGENLSGGEAQKLSLARIFADNTPFVILDEPSGALDPIAEYTMFENMIRATEGRSVIFISHRLSSAVLADRVILMDGGTIAESGTHEELIALNGKYAEMFRRQAENYLGSEVRENA